jgi:hypothetical protein
VVVMMLSACKQAEEASPEGLWETLVEDCAAKDASAIREHTDLLYQDDLGGPGRLEDDLRRLFSVYDRLHIGTRDLKFDDREINGSISVEGKRLRFQGPLALVLNPGPRGPQVRAGLLTDLRAILLALRDRREALESGFTEFMFEAVSPEYQGKAGGREALMAKVRERLAAQGESAIIAQNVEIGIEGDQAQVAQDCLVLHPLGKKPGERKIQEKLRLRKEGTRWRFTGGLDDE